MLQQWDKHWKKINEEYKLEREEYHTQFQRWKATLRDQQGEKPQALKQLMKKETPLDITHDEQGLDNSSIDGDDKTNVEETQEVPSNDED